MTTHVFIVDATTFKYHLEYQFVGTGKGNEVVDLNNSTNEIHHAKENNMLSMIADFSRVQIGDLVIFYLQQNFEKGIHEGKFYGVFKIKSLVFLDNNDKKQFLKNELQKSLTFRCLIEPHIVYSKGVTEWEALDEIKNIHSPNQMLWSLIYRKLKGNRGNTMITIYESERLIKLIRDKNSRNILNVENFSFDLKNQEIIALQDSKEYIGRKDEINILPRLIKKYLKNNQFEAHLQTYILQKFYQTKLFGILNNENIEWLGNEVSCGVGMQRIDIMASIEANNTNPRKIIPIELKSSQVYPSILTQVKRYVDWLEQYYIPNCPSDIQPMIICRYIDKNSNQYKDFKLKCEKFNKNNNILEIAYIEFKIENNKITFERVF
ncbi:DUF91 domain-containing protein [Brachyspira aalborgi]|uniref:DUF91 domain-containing protein n=1 Tax=Brachyspira aalborgi TaxID=29522 RepID=A0A5C8E6A5_9SPIR|nr:DUF91 domain-containing protein [Brachyspira aalborgi]TXJ33517.1 DUF91 domain-containing protein [Brachyspira aalborgi]